MKKPSGTAARETQAGFAMTEMPPTITSIQTNEPTEFSTKAN